MRPLLLTLCLATPFGIGSPPQEESEPVGEEAQEETPAETPSEEPAWKDEWEAEVTARIVTDFRITDLDRNGWLSLREVAGSLGVEREEYARHDANQDGRWDDAEFEERFRTLLARIGSVPAPRVRSAVEEEVSQPLTPPSPLEVLRTFDKNGDQALNDQELLALAEANGVKLPVQVIKARVDTDGSGLIELSELEALTVIFEKRLRFMELPENVTPESSNPFYRSTPLDPLARLDIDADGFVSLDELTQLGAGQRFKLRPSAVLATLDADGDGLLSRDELLHSM